MSYQYRGPVTDAAVTEAEDRIRAKLDSLARLEAELDERINRIRNAPVFRTRGATAACGTHSGYKAHSLSQTPVCTPCRIAHNLYQREYRARKKMAA